MFLARLAALSIRYPRRVLLTVFGLVVLATLGASHLEIKTSNLDLIDPGQPDVARFLEFTERFGNPNGLVVVLEGTDPDNLRKAVDLLTIGFQTVPGIRTCLAKLPFKEEDLASMGLDGYFTSQDEDLFFIFLQPENARTEVVALTPLIRAVEEQISAADLPRLAVKAGLTGIPKYALDDQQVIRGDITRLSGLALLLVALLLGLGLKRPGVVLAVIVTLLISLALSAGIASIYPGHLSLMSALFASILFGLGIDYGIHIAIHLDRFKEKELPWSETLNQTFTHLTKPLKHACITSAGAFSILLGTGFRGFAELGFLAGISLIVCLFCMYSALPAILVLFKPSALVKNRQTAPRWHSLTGPNPVLAFFGLALAIVCVWQGLPGFDSDYRKLQPSNSETVRLESAMIEQSDLSPYFAAFTCASRSEAQALAEALRMHALVASVRSETDFDDWTDAAGNPLELPRDIQALFRDNAGHFAVLAYPKGAIWDSQVQTDFLNAMRTYDPEVTGMPFLAETMMRQSERALFISMFLAAGLVLLFARIDFGSFGNAVLVFVPPAFAVILLIGWVSFSGAGLNPLNMMAIPIVLGIAVDDSAHIFHQMHQTGGDWGQTLRTSGKAVLLTTWTTLAAFGVLCFAHHRGLQSFCLALCVGVGAALYAVLFIQPWLLKCFANRHGSKQKRSRDLQPLAGGLHG